MYCMHRCTDVFSQCVGGGFLFSVIHLSLYHRPPPTLEGNETKKYFNALQTLAHKYTMTHNHAFMLTQPTSYSPNGRCRNHMEVAHSCCDKLLITQRH